MRAQHKKRNTITNIYRQYADKSMHVKRWYTWKEIKNFTELDWIYVHNYLHPMADLTNLSPMHGDSRGDYIKAFYMGRVRGYNSCVPKYSEIKLKEGLYRGSSIIMSYIQPELDFQNLVAKVVGEGVIPNTLFFTFSETKFDIID